MSLFEAWCPGVGECEGDAEDYDTVSAMHAAEGRAADLYREGYRFHEIRICVRRPVTGELEVIDVDVELQPEFSGRKVR